MRRAGAYSKINSWPETRQELNLRDHAHTPTPWYAARGSIWTTPGGDDDAGIRIALADRDEHGTTPNERDANIECIVCRVNVHDALLAALSAVVEAGRTSNQSSAVYCADIARAALAQVPP